MSLNRQKVDYNDPLSFLSGGGVDNAKEDATVQYINEETDFRTVDLEKVQFGAGKKKKNEKTSNAVVSDASSNLTTSLPSLGPRPITPPIGKEEESRPAPISSSTTASDIPPMPRKAKPIIEEEEDIFVVKKKTEIEEDEDIFSFTKEASSSSKKQQQQTYVPKPIAKIDFTNEDDDDVSDLNVAKLLEREEQLDFNLFGKVNTSTEKQRTAKKKMDLDQESDFLKQLDEITTTSSKKLSASASKSSSATNEFDFQFSNKQNKQNQNPSTTDFDINSLNLDDYISQNASSGGGLFDD
jgi:hypothetical protein